MKKIQNSDYKIENNKDTTVVITEKDKNNNKSTKTMSLTKKITLGAGATLGGLFTIGTPTAMGVLTSQVAHVNTRVDLLMLESLILQKELIQRNINDLDRFKMGLLDYKTRLQELANQLENINNKINKIKGDN